LTGPTNKSEDCISTAYEDHVVVRQATFVRQRMFSLEGLIYTF